MSNETTTVAPAADDSNLEAIPGQEAETTQADGRKKGGPRKRPFELADGCSGFTSYPFKPEEVKDGNPHYAEKTETKLNRDDFANDDVYATFREAMRDDALALAEEEYNEAVAKITSDCEADLLPVTAMKNAGIEDESGKISAVFAKFLKDVPEDKRAEVMAMMAATM